MDIMKNTDSQPIELSECLAAFSKPEELGDDELWWVWSMGVAYLKSNLLCVGIVRNVRPIDQLGRHLKFGSCHLFW